MNNRFETLKIFCSLAETLQFKETANRLAVSPPVVTRVIAELESYLGEALFTRNTRQVQLTDFGEQFLPQAQRLLMQSEKLFVPKAQRAEEIMRGTVRITVPGWREMDGVLAQLLAALDPYPDLVIDWRNGMEKLDAVTYRIDIGVRIGLQPEPDFIVRHIADIADMLVAAPSLVARLGSPQSLDELERRYPFTTSINPATGRPWHFPLNQDITLKPQQIRLLCDDLHIGLQSALQGSTVGLFSDFICRPLIARGELVQLFPDIPIQKWRLYLYRPYETVTPPRVLKVFDLLEGILKKRFAQDAVL